MADSEIAGLTEDTTPDLTDNVYAQSADGNTDKRVPISAFGTLYALLSGATFTGDIIVPDEAYSATTWNGNLEAPTKNAVRDQFVALDASVPHLTGNETIAGIKTFSSDPVIPDEAYDATAWNGSLEPPTKNAVRDKFETLNTAAAGDGIDIDTVGTVSTFSTIGPDIQTFASSGTWTKPSGAKLVRVVCIGPGGGGGSGRRGASSSDRFGGGGGTGGGVSQLMFDADALGSTETVTVGTGGTAGAAQTSDSTDGNAGSNGSGSTTFGSWVSAGAGIGGSGGTATTGTGGAWATGNRRYNLVVGEGGSGTTGAPSGAGFGGHTGGGASGGAVTAANQGRQGGTGGGSPSAAGVAGGTGGAAGNPGTQGGTGLGDSGGGGGSGGGGNTTGAGGTGGAGGSPGGGGGGGGGSVNGQSSGAGGAGADGACLVYTYF